MSVYCASTDSIPRKFDDFHQTIIATKSKKEAAVRFLAHLLPNEFVRGHTIFVETKENEFRNVSKPAFVYEFPQCDFEKGRHQFRSFDVYRQKKQTRWITREEIDLFSAARKLGSKFVCLPKNADAAVDEKERTELFYVGTKCQKEIRPSDTSGILVSATIDGALADYICCGESFYNQKSRLVVVQIPWPLPKTAWLHTITAENCVKSRFGLGLQTVIKTKQVFRAKKINPKETFLLRGNLILQ